MTEHVLPKAFLSRRRDENDEDPFQSDVERILHSKAFARYADKTQVVYLLPHDHITYRGLHVQLVSSLARAVGRKLDLSLGLIEAISLGHDIGHAPFGHDGEGYLSELSQEEGIGAFSHSRQSCRVASEIEPMNLTLATLDGMLCHDGGMRTRMLEVVDLKDWKQHEEELERRVVTPAMDLAPGSLEGALVKLADTASYLERDLEDAVTLGIISAADIPKNPFGEKSLRAVVAGDIEHVFRKTGSIGTSEEVFAYMQELRRFDFERIYCHAHLKRESKKIHAAYRLMFYRILEEWRQSGKNSVLWRHFLHSKDEKYIEGNPSAVHVVDYMSGMTDGYFLRLFQELFVPRMIEVPDVLPFC
jgi:dGTPase